jgi:hypothetical protein
MMQQWQSLPVHFKNWDADERRKCGFFFYQRKSAFYRDLALELDTINRTVTIKVSGLFTGIVSNNPFTV